MAVNRFVLNGISYHGHGAINEIPGIVKSKGFKKAFVASDPDLVKFGVTAKVTDLLKENGIEYELYSDIKPNPTIENVLHGVDAYKASEADFMITIGGGSSMDTGKAIGIIINNPEFADVRSLEGVAPTKKRTVFTIAVPTTGGTGAESTINYVITDVEKKRKFVCVDPNDIPDVAVVDPDMMASMPKGLTASTGMDALTHAIEGYTTAGAWELSDCLDLEAIKLIAANLRKAVENDPDGREGMALAQYVTAMAYSNVGLGIAHSMAHTLGAVYDTPHGVACAMMLPILSIPVFPASAFAKHSSTLFPIALIMPSPVTTQRVFVILSIFISFICHHAFARFLSTCSEYTGLPQSFLSGQPSLYDLLLHICYNVLCKALDVVEVLLCNTCHSYAVSRIDTSDNLQGINRIKSNSITKQWNFII